MSHRKEQGNILGYVLVGVLLAALVIGGIFVVRRYLPSSDTTGTSSSSDGTPTATTDAPTKPSTETDKNSEELKAALAQQAAEEKKAQEQKAANESKPATTTTTGTTTGSTSAATASVATGTDANKLPATGPEDTALSMVGITLVTALAVAYVRSRALI